MRALIVGGLLALVGAIATAQAGQIKIVAAENFYADIARQIGGPSVSVTSILSNPSQDPHLFEVSPSVGREVTSARIVVYNGIDYDPWMEKLLAAATSGDRQSIVVARLIGRRTGDNPHIWYDPATMLALAEALSSALVAADPAGQAEYQERLARFAASLRPIRAKIAELRVRTAGMPAIATEPVFGYMFDALGMPVRNQSFQRAVMNGTEPSASDIAAFERDLKTRQVKLLAYNSQTSNPLADRMRQLALASDIPVIGVTETEPEGKDYQGWMIGVLDAIDRAVPGQTR